MFIRTRSISLRKRGGFFTELIDGKLRADEEGDGVAERGVLADGEKLHRTVVADLLENLKFAGLLAQDDEALGAEDFFGQRGEEFFEILF